MGASRETSRPPSWVQRVLIGRDPRRTLVRIVIWIAVCVLISNFALLPIRVIGVSMLPTYKHKSVNFVNCLAYVFHEPRRGDVVAIRFSGKHVMLMKRIIALPGETVAFHQGRAWINGKVLDEPYVKFPSNWEHEPEEVGPDEYYVVGDNRSMDYSLHEQGRPERKRILGKVLL
jgi:signal peptidase I